MNYRSLPVPRPHRALFLLAGLLVVLGTGCADDPPRADVVFGTYDSGGSSNDVGLEGTLVVKEGCLMLEPPGGEAPELMLAWDKGYAAIADGDDIVVVRDGEEVAEVGEEVTLGGGPIGPASMETSEGDPIPEECITKNMFGVSDHQDR